LKENGLTIKCMEKGFLNGKMEENIKENTLKTKNRVMENSFGRTGGFTKETGKMVNNMDKDCIRVQTV
jgi:hypothetical protein